MLVQDIKKTVCESPEEEEDGDEGDGDDGLPGGDLRGTSDQLVTDALPTGGLTNCVHGRRSTLAMDFFKGGLDFLAEHGCRDPCSQ